MNTKSSLTLSLIALSAAVAQADVTINFDVDGLRDATGGVFAPTSTLVLLVADFGSAGFGTPFAGFNTTNLSMWGEDVVMARFNLSDGDGVRQIALTGLSDTFALRSFAMFWFPTLGLSDNVLLNGSAYGNSLPITWVAPPVGGLDGYSLFGINNTGNLSSNPFLGGVSNANMTASLIVIPEPSSFAALAGLAVLGMVVARRRRSA